MVAYATFPQLYALGVNADALTPVSEKDQMEALEAASRLVDTYLWKLNPPLAVFTGEISEAACVIAAYTVMSSRGFDPDHDDSKNLRLRYLDKIRWLESLDGGAKLPGAVGQGPAGAGMLGPRVRAAPLRGWDRGFRTRRGS